MPDVEVTGSAGRWLATEGRTKIGVLHAVLRPDRRCFLEFEDCDDEAYDPLVAAAAAEHDGDLYATLEESDEPGLRRLYGLGFTVHRHEHLFRIATDPWSHGLRVVAPPDGVALVSAVDADLDRLRALDDALRQDIPGADGWRWTPDAFRRQTLGGSDFDPATYLVAVDRRTGSYVGLVRVWMNPTGPRLGCLGVLPAFRRTRVTAALVAAVATVLHDRGHPAVVTEISADNHAALALLARRPVTRTGGSYELVRRRRDCPTAASGS